MKRRTTIMAMSVNTIDIIGFLQVNKDKNFTAAEIADQMGLSTQTVNGAFTAGIQRKGYGVRIENEIFDEETNRHKVVKYLKLNDAGLALDLEHINDEEADAE